MKNEEGVFILICALLVTGAIWGFAKWIGADPTITFAAIGYSAGGQELYLDFYGDTTTGDCTWRVSAYQIHRFDTCEQAQAFLCSGAFAES